MDNKKAYECMLVVNAKLDEAKREKIVDKFAKMAGEPTIEKLGQKKYGYYYLLNFVASVDLPAKMMSLMKITDGVVRYLFVAKTDVMLKQDVIRKQYRAKAREEFLARKEKEAKEAKAVVATPAKEAQPEKETKEGE